jgi:hypothetical protein
MSEFQTTYNQAGLIGQPITSTLLTVISNLATAALAYLSTEGVIAGYTMPSVIQDAGNPDQVDVTFGYSPMYPLNYIQVTYSINQTTGSVSPTGGATGNASSTSQYSSSAISSS